MKNEYIYRFRNSLKKKETYYLIIDLEFSLVISRQSKKSFFIYICGRYLHICPFTYLLRLRCNFAKVFALYFSFKKLVLLTLFKQISPYDLSKVKLIHKMFFQIYLIIRLTFFSYIQKFE